MSRNIFVNMPVKDLQKSMNFFENLGFTFNQHFTDKTAACIVVGDGIFVMLMTEPKFQGFISKELCDPTKQIEMLVCLSAESRSEVDELVQRAVAFGGSVHREAQDYGFMYGHGFQDLDGHVWELAFMEPSAWQHKA